MSTRERIDDRSDSWTFKTQVHFRRGARGRKHLREGEAVEAVPSVPGRIPRVARLLALAHRFEKLVQAGEVRGYADLARLAGVTRARMTQIMNLLYLAPDIQDAILHMQPTFEGRDSITEREIRPVAAHASWLEQRKRWSELSAESC